MKLKLQLLTFIVVCCVHFTALGQTTNTLPFYDSMDYTVGADVFPSNTNQSIFGTWYTQDPRSDVKQEVVASPTWSLSSNVETPSGAALRTSTSGEDPELFFTEQTSGEVFVSMFIQIHSSFSSNLAASATDPDRIFEIAEASTGTSAAAASVFVRAVLDGGVVVGVEFGINEDGVAADVNDVNWSGTTHSANEQLFLVFSYTKNSSSDTAAKLWINPVVNGIEPSATVEDTTTQDKDPVRFSFNVRGSTVTPIMITDEFRIGNSWNDVAPVKGSTGNGAVSANITTTTTPTFPVYESFDNYATDATLINANTETGIGAWGTKDVKSSSDMTVVDSPTWGSSGTDIGVNNAGKAMSFSGGGEDGYLEFTKTAGSFGTVYASFLMKVTDLTSVDTDNYRFVGFGRKNSTSVSGATTIYVQKDASDATKYNLGLNETNSTSATPTFVGGAADPTEYAIDQELFVVIYFDDATDGDGITAKMWINPVISGAEPTPTVTDPTDRGLDVDLLVFTQASSVRTPGVTFDEIRIASTWDEVTKVKHTWTGATADWATNTNWDNNLVPSTLSNVIIPSGASNQPVIGATTGVAVHNLSIDAAASLSITSGGSLQSTGNVTGDFTYNLSITDDKWHYASSPVIGEEYNDAWVTANGIASGTGNNRGISWYDNSSSDPTTGNWRYMQQGDNGVFQAKGYALKRTGSGTYAFTGTFPRANFELPISQNNGNNWNLINNPYPSYISVADLVSTNSANLGSLFQNVYVWNPNNGANGAYEILTSGHIHPGQAFFINSNVASGNLNITEALQSAQTGVTFYKNSAKPNIELLLSKNDIEVKTTFNLLENATNGLNPGQDFGLFTGVKSDFSVSSYLVEGNTGVPLTIQSLAISNLENIEIPIGVVAKKDDEIIFSAKSFELPNGISLILEDRVNNTTTDLSDINAEYKLKLTEDVNGVGRFYLVTASKALSTENVSLDQIKIFKTSNSNLKITGLTEGKFDLKLYNILGKQILNTSFISNGVKEFKLPRISAGIYIVELNSEKGKLSKKIKLE